MMKTMPAIGTRVKYHRKAERYMTERTCTGTVVAQYRGGDKHTDPETGEEYTTPDAVERIVFGGIHQNPIFTHYIPKGAAQPLAEDAIA